MKFSKHAEQRTQQRAIKPHLVSIILEHGTPVERPGHTVEYRFVRKDAHALIQEHKEAIRCLERAKDKAVLVAGDNQTVITTYHIYR